MDNCLDGGIIVFRVSGRQDGKDGQSFQSGKVTVELLAGRSDVIESRVTDPGTEADQRIENALLFVFDTDGNCVAKQWMEMEGYTTQEIFLPSSSKYIYAICNLMDPMRLCPG